MANAYSAADELVHITTALALQEKFVAGDSDYVFYLHLPAEHLTYILLDEWQKMADYSADRAAVSQPATVEYYYDPAQAYPACSMSLDELRDALGIETKSRRRFFGFRSRTG